MRKHRAGPKFSSLPLGGPDAQQQVWERSLSNPTSATVTNSEAWLPHQWFSSGRLRGRHPGPDRCALLPPAAKLAGLRARQWLVIAVVALLALGALGGVPPVLAGSLTRADLQARFPPPLVVGERLTDLPVWPVFKPDNGKLQLIAQAFETVDLEAVAGYGGKPVNLLVVVDRDGVFLTVELLAHGEPLFTSQAGTARLGAFAQQYQGLTLAHDIQIGSPAVQRRQTDSTALLHGVMTGTVSASAIDRAVLESAAQVAMAQAGGTAERLRGPDDRYRRSGWIALADAGLLQHWVIDNRKVQAAFADGPGAWRDPGGMGWGDGKAVDFWLSPVGLPQAGRNLLDPAGWRQVRAVRESGQTLLMVIDGGRYPVAHAAQPDDRRLAVLRLRQNGRDFLLQPFDYQGRLALSGTRSGVARNAVPRLYTVPPAADGEPLDLEQPLSLELELQRGSGSLGDVALARVSRPFSVPDAAQYRPQRETPAWMAGWAKRQGDLVVLAIGLVVLSVALARQRWLSASLGRLAVLRTAYLVFTLGFIGWWAQGQLSIVSLTAAIEASRAGRALDFLLADPVAVLLWGYTGVTLLVWGRGTFCGWLCPFGALQELISGIARVLRLRPRTLRRGLDQRLKWLKYGVLAVLCTIAALAPALTETAVEVEPFKTAISAYFQRDWPYVLWAALCVAASVLVYRGYCRYLCPLGAALAIAGRLRLWRWIPRRAECGTPCQTCRHRCSYQAITPAGQVQYDECFQCLDCVQVYQNPTQCLPLVRAARSARAVIPIAVVPVAANAP